jgi:Transcriptional regulator PadR-like family
MPQQREPGLSLADWLVLCVISEAPTHGFAIACLLAHDGSLGRVWHVQKPVIYRAARRLEHLGLIAVAEKAAQQTGGGPGSAAGHGRGPPVRRKMAARTGRPSPGYPLRIAGQACPARPGGGWSPRSAASAARPARPGRCCAREPDAHRHRV